MKYEEILAQNNDGQALCYLGRLHGLDLSPRQPVAELKRLLLERLRNLSYLEAYIGKLPQAEQQGLQVTVFGSKGLLPAPDNVHRRLNELSRRTGRKGGTIMASLLNKGLVFSGRDRSYSSIYIVPDEVVQVVLASAAKLCGVDVTAAFPARPAAGMDVLSLLSDLHLFLGWLRRDPLRLTQAGLIYRRDQQRLLASFNPPEELTPGREPPYPPRLNLYLAFCDRHNLIDAVKGVNGEGYLTITPRADAWMKKSLTQQTWELIAYLKSYIEGPGGSVQGKILRLLGSLPEERWLSASRLIPYLTLFAADPWYRPEQEVPEAVAELSCFGLIEKATLEKEEFIRFTASGREFYLGIVPRIQEENSFLVQPNYEVLVPQELKPALRWELDAFTDVVKNDRVVVLKLSEAGIYRAFKQGKDPAEFLAWLSRHTRVTLPENVAYSLRDWCGRCGSVYLEQPLLLTCRSEELAAEVVADPRFQPYLRGRFGARHLLVDPEKYRELLAALEAAGYMPRPDILPSTPPRAAQPGEEPSTGVKPLRRAASALAAENS